jgi:hypothetical protein
LKVHRALGTKVNRNHLLFAAESSKKLKSLFNATN